LISWGSVPDWLSGVGTVSALAFAAVAARSALRADRQQGLQLQRLQQTDMERESDRRRSQAARVAAWIVLHGDAAQSSPAVWCVNGSGGPVCSVTMWCESAAGTVAVDYAVKTPDTQPKKLNYATSRLISFVEEVAANDSRLSILAPDRQRMVRPDISWWSMYSQGLLRVSTQFLDADGRWWRRDGTGKLTELQVPPSSGS